MCGSVDRACATSIEIGRFQRRVAQQMIAERDHHLPVLARIRIGDRGDLAVADRAARIGQQRCMQRALDHAGFRRRRQLGPREIDLEESSVTTSPPPVVAVEQMMAAGEPEILHRASCSPRARSRPDRPGPPAPPRPPLRGTRTPHRLRLALRGCSVRNASRTSPSSDVRCTAISVSADDCTASSANATSSSAAARAAARSGAPKCATSCCASSSDERRAIRLARLDDLHQRRPAERLDAEKPAAKRRARPCPRASPASVVPEHERARHRPFAGLGRALEHERVRGIEPDGAQQLHSARPAGFRDRARTAWRAPARASALDVGLAAVRRTSRSPFSSMSRRTALSRAAGATDSPSRRRRSRRSCQASMCDHQMPREALRPARPRRVRRSLLPRARPRADASPARCSVIDTVRIIAPNTSQSGGSSSLAPSGQASRPPPTSPPSTRIASGQSIVDRLFRRRMRRKRVGQRGHAGIEARAAPCAAARPAPAPRRTRRDRSGRHRPAFRRPASGAIDSACANASPTSRKRHKRERRRQFDAFAATLRVVRAFRAAIGSPAYFFIWYNYKLDRRAHSRPNSASRRSKTSMAERRKRS